MLAALREAGVVGAGGHALTVIFAGAGGAGVLRDEAPPELDHYAPARSPTRRDSPAPTGIRTNFAVTGEGLVPSRSTGALGRDRRLRAVVGDRARSR